MKNELPKNLCVGGYGLLRSRNFANMATWRNNFSLHSRAGLVWTGTVHNATKKPSSRGAALLRYNDPQNHLMGEPIWVSYPRNSLGGARAIRGSVWNVCFYLFKACFSRYTRQNSRLLARFRGGSSIFFRRGCTRLLLYFNTNKPHSFFFFAEYQLY